MTDKIFATIGEYKDFFSAVWAAPEDIHYQRRSWVPKWLWRRLAFQSYCTDSLYRAIQEEGTGSLATTVYERFQ